MRRRIARKAQQGFTLIELMIVVAIVGILAVLAIYGVSKYMINAKTAEARNALGMLGKAAVSGYEQESTSAALIAPGTSGLSANHALCLSAAAVPDAVGKVSNRKYQSSTADWFPTTDTARTGWTCLKFSLTEPQYFAYDYNSTTTTFEGTAESDLSGAGNGTATLSFKLTGALASTGQLVVAPALDEINGPATAAAAPAAP